MCRPKFKACFESTNMHTHSCPKSKIQMSRLILLDDYNTGSLDLPFSSEKERMIRIKEADNQGLSSN